MQSTTHFWHVLQLLDQVISWSMQGRLRYKFLCMGSIHINLVSPLCIKIRRRDSCSSSSSSIMEKSKSFPYYSSSYAEARFGFEDRAKSFSFNGPEDNPEVKRRKRVASYNMYTMEGKLKSSLRNGFKWIKNKFTDKYDGLWSIKSTFSPLLMFYRVRMCLYKIKYHWKCSFLDFIVLAILLVWSCITII